MATLNEYHLSLQYAAHQKEFAELSQEIALLKGYVNFSGTVIDPIDVIEARVVAAKLREILDLEIELGLNSEPVIKKESDGTVLWLRNIE